MANWYCDSVGGSDINGGTSWVDAIKTLAVLYTKGVAGDHYYFMGNGSAAPYIQSTAIAPLNRHWHGYRLRDGYEGMPWLKGNIGTERCCENGYGVDNIYFTKFTDGAYNLQGAWVIEKCVFVGITGRAVLMGAGAYAICRYNLFLNCATGVKIRHQTVDRHIFFYHNTFYGCTSRAFWCESIVGAVKGYDAWHSNIFSSGARGAYFDAVGTLVFHGAGEPNYNVWYSNSIADIIGAVKGANDISGTDPLFVYTNSLDVRLSPGSVALYSDGSNMCRGGIGPGPKPHQQMRHNKFFAAGGHLIETNTIWRDVHLIGT